MSRTKTLRVVGSLAALVAFAALPAIAQATTQLQAGGKEMPVGTSIRGQGRIGVDIQNAENKISTEWECTSNEIVAEATKNQGADAQAVIGEVKMGGCDFGGVKADVTTNASLVAPWTLQFQEPEQPIAPAHIQPAAGSSLKFKVQIQVFGFSAATCEYTAGSLQISGFEFSDNWSIEGIKQMTREAGPEMCGTVGDVEGAFQFENSKAEKAQVDMT